MLPAAHSRSISFPAPIIIGNADVKELDLEAAAGMIELTGTVRGNIGAECSAGNIGLTLYASENDYDLSRFPAPNSMSIIFKFMSCGRYR